MYECQLSIGHEILQTTNKMLPILIFIYLINPLNAQHGNSYKLKNRIFKKYLNAQVASIV